MSAAASISSPWAIEIAGPSDSLITRHAGRIRFIKSGARQVLPRRRGPGAAHSPGTRSTGVSRGEGRGPRRPGERARQCAAEKSDRGDRNARVDGAPAEREIEPRNGTGTARRSSRERLEGGLRILGDNRQERAGGRVG